VSFSATVAGIVGVVDEVLEGRAAQAGPEALDRIDRRAAARSRRRRTA